MNGKPLLVGAFVGAVGGVPAVAAEWSAAPLVTWTLDHQSNRNLQPEAQESQGALVGLDMALKRATETSEISIRPRLLAQRYSDDTVADATDASLLVAGTWQNERGSLGAEAFASRQNTLTSELDDTGLTRGDTVRNTRSAAVTWMRAVSERRSRQIQLSFSDVDYSGEYQLALPGYRYPGVSISERVALSGRTAISVSAFGNELLSRTGLADSRTYGLQLSLERQLTPRLSALVGFGLNDSEQGGETQDGYVAQLNLAHEMELGKWSLDYSHSLAASGRGVLVERDRATLGFTRDLSSRLRLRAEARAVRNDDVGSRPSFSGERHRYDVAEAGFDWRASRTWTIGWRAGAARGDQPFEGEAGEGWRTSVVAWWSPRPWTISR